MKSPEPYEPSERMKSVLAVAGEHAQFPLLLKVWPVEELKALSEDAAAYHVNRKNVLDKAREQKRNSMKIKYLFNRSAYDSSDKMHKLLKKLIKENENELYSLIWLYLETERGVEDDYFQDR